MADTDTITVEDTEGEGRMLHEAEACLGLSKVRLTLGALMLLGMGNSPYVCGGKPAAEDEEAALKIIQHECRREDFSRLLAGEIELAMQAYTLLDEFPEHSGRESDIPPFSPEWMSDIISLAAQSLPSLTLRQALWETPLAMLVHLGLSTARRNGGITRRDLGAEEAIRRLLERRKTENGGANG